ncbi:maltokinase N-terminal cap-like domain-containing protein [Kutzneria kofuensis]|uniref:Maltokinase N-terminal cap domain-containing protein n=1 Tax=Kutzneria kofuensis TaxID=103725 RepID=A0A7W9KL30_9PSEU|nr:1,4-alpha-glucan branching protein [Kutzneria kofuensis]MBB5894447.1 hypothetical protein [Kutzneria kofuensis]
MSLIHRTTLTPSKLELLTDWLPGQPWYRGAGAPELAKAGGFRLDDPANVVGIEFAAVADGDVTYHVPMTYRSEPLEDGEQALIGVTQHGVLGRRLVYDGVHDPVLVRTLVALFNGEVRPQMQSVNHTVDETVTATGGPIEPETWTVTANTADGTDLRLRPDLVLRIRRCLADPLPAHVGGVTATVLDSARDETQAPLILLLG